MRLDNSKKIFFHQEKTYLTLDNFDISGTYKLVKDTEEFGIVIRTDDN